MATTFKPPATQRRYDVCVLGAGVGGAAAGALLSRRGFRVLLVDEGGRAPRADGGWLLPSEPTLQPSLRHLPAAEALLGEVGLASDAIRAQEHLAPDLQLLLQARHRLDLQRDPAALAAELRREWPAQATRLLAGLQALLADADAGGRLLLAGPPLPPAGFFDRYALRKALRQAAVAGLTARPPLQPLEDHPLGAALAALPWLLGQLDGPPAPLGVARLAGLALRGLVRPAPGVPSLEEALRRKVAEARGDLLGSPAEPAVVESIGLEGGRLATLRLAGSTDAFAARAFLLAGSLGWLLPLLGEAPASARKVLGRLRPGRRLAALHRVVRPSALPPGLGSAALVLGAAARTAGEAVLLEVQPARPDARKGAAAPAEALRLVSAWTVAEDGEGGARDAQARIEGALDEALPFLAGHVVHAPRLFLTPHLHAVQDPAVGVGGLPVRSPWKNLLLCGREVVPGLGLEGELYAALQAAAQAAALLGVKGKPR